EKLNRLKEDEPIIIDEHTFLSYPAEKLVIVGDGAEKCRPYVDPRVRIMQVLPEAKMMHQAVLHAFAQKQFEHVAYFEPFYLKEYTPGTSKKNTL
ncbi:MAG: tRNA ((37)-N6)-threonylcarbamoyltransferase complex dimerization subunit type 1 TsaB, partial [Bacteroidota bacterium]